MALDEVTKQLAEALHYEGCKCDKFPKVIDDDLEFMNLHIAYWMARARDTIQTLPLEFVKSYLRQYHAYRKMVVKMSEWIPSPFA